MSSNDSSTPTAPNDLDLVIITCLTGAFGCVLSFIVLMIMMYSPVFKNSFGSITASTMLASTLFLALFATVVTYEFRYPNVLPPLILYIGGWAQNSLSYVILYLSFLMSVNRYCAVTLPFRYKVYFATHRTSYYIYFAWFLAFLLMSPSLFNNCRFWFSGDLVSFMFEDNQCGDLLSTIVDLYFNVTIGICGFLLDLWTLYRLLWEFKKAQAAGRPGSLAKFAKGELRQMYQALANSVSYITSLMIFHVGNYLDTEGRTMFWRTVYAWEFFYVVNVVVLILIYKELRRIPEKKPKENSFHTATTY